MKKIFKEVRIGEKFYPAKDKGGMDLGVVLMKVGAIQFTFPGPWTGLNTTDNVLRYSGINAVIVGSPKEKNIDGTYDFITDDQQIYPANLCF